eukprot:TRINITY_DN2504_c0_g1_i1.p1 TRINITY_DN2504_c0_g1~~TRINITY_DN2504_c0_g1_i1.p1  ORF type:complete len:149 (-),score=42.29 TRINITY_DN2504_c0_g1_i1:381-827(-)
MFNGMTFVVCGKHCSDEKLKKTILDNGGQVLINENSNSVIVVTDDVVSPLDFLTRMVEESNIARPEDERKQEAQPTSIDHEVQPGDVEEGGSFVVPVDEVFTEPGCEVLVEDGVVYHALLKHEGQIIEKFYLLQLIKRSSGRIAGLYR